MPSITLHPLSTQSQSAHEQSTNPLPRLLHTPSGLALLELQGTIHAPVAPTDDEDVTKGVSASTQIGNVVFPLWSPDTDASDTNWMKRVYLYVGKHQRLTGEVKKLPKAIAVVARRYSTEETGRDELEVREIVRYKIVFSSRPEPVGDDAGG